MIMDRITTDDKSNDIPGSSLPIHRLMLDWNPKDVPENDASHVNVAMKSP